MIAWLNRVLNKDRRLSVKEHAAKGSRWALLAILAAVIGAPFALVVTGLLNGDDKPIALSDTVNQEAAPDAPGTAPRDPFDAGMRRGYGPPRSTFRCARPSLCHGPTYVTFNSYFNAVNYGDERAFFDVKRIGESNRAPWSDSLYIEKAQVTLRMRAYVHNNTYQELPGKETDALDTRLRVVLPRGAVYEAHPTAYLRAENAKPQVIWDTVDLYASRPMRMTYVPGSAEITRRKDPEGAFVTRPAPEGVNTPEGMALGRWKADFPYSGLITFKVRVSFLPEPVRDPRATWQTAGSRAVSVPATSTGPLREPAVDSSGGARFSCTDNACLGAPYVTLNAYRNHPLLGDEADFLRAEPVSTYGETGEHRYRPVVRVRPGDQLNVRLAIDNGGDPGAIGAPPSARLVARGVRARVILPTGPANSQSIVAVVESRNAEPTRIIDTLPIRSAEPVRIRYQADSASIATSRGARGAGRGLLALASTAEDRVGRWGLRVPPIPPSFSRVIYIGFIVVAWPA